MKIVPQIGDTVKCPPDRGDSGYMAKVIHITPGEHMGRKFWWCTVQRMGGTPGGVWASNRLGYTERVEK